MKAILINNDRSLRWDNVPDSVPGEREVLIEIHYAAYIIALTHFTIEFCVWI